MVLKDAPVVEIENDDQAMAAKDDDEVEITSVRNTYVPYVKQEKMENQEKEKKKKANRANE